MRCSFCIYSFYRSNNIPVKVVHRDIDRLIAMISSFKEKGGKYVVFMDDNILSDRTWAERFFSEYSKKIGLPFSCIVHPAYVNNKTSNMLKKSGCISVEVGIQVMNQRLRNEVLDRYESDSQIKSCLKILKENRMYTIVDHIMGIPGEEEDDHIRSLHIYRKYRVDRIILSYMTCYPGTAVNRYSEVISGDSIHGFKEPGDNIQKNIVRMSFLFNTISILPEPVFRYFLKNRLYRKIPYTVFFTNIIPYLIISCRRQELNLRLFILRYITFIRRRLLCMLKSL